MGAEPPVSSRSRLARRRGEVAQRGGLQNRYSSVRIRSSPPLTGEDRPSRGPVRRFWSHPARRGGPGDRARGCCRGVVRGRGAHPRRGTGRGRRQRPPGHDRDRRRLPDAPHRGLGGWRRGRGDHPDRPAVAGGGRDKRLRRRDVGHDGRAAPARARRAGRPARRGARARCGATCRRSRLRSCSGRWRSATRRATCGLGGSTRSSGPATDSRAGACGPAAAAPSPSKGYDRAHPEVAEPADAAVLNTAGGDPL